MTDVPSHRNEQRTAYGTAASDTPGGRDFVNALQDAVRENPASAALIGMGVLWMFMGGSNTSLFGGSGRKSIFRAAGEGAEEVGGAVRDTAAHVGPSLGRAASTAAETAFQVAGEVRQAVGERASRTAAQAAGAVASAYDATSGAAANAVDTISNATTTTGHAIQATGEKWGRTVQQNIAELFERQPLLLGAVGIAIGAGIAASIPLTEAENKVMGDASDSLSRVVTEKAAQIREMADAALDQAKAQGLIPEAASEAVKTFGDTVGSAVKAASH